MDDKELEEKITVWLNDKETELICFNCKRQAHFVYAPEDMAWGPYLVCKDCQANFDKLLSFAEGECAPGTH